MNTNTVRWTLAGIVVLSGALAFFFTDWGAWVSATAIVAYALGRSWIVVRYGKAQGGAIEVLRAPLMFVGFLVFGVSFAMLGFFIGLAISTGKSPFPIIGT